MRAFLLVALAAALTVGPRPHSSQLTPPTVVLLVRHAEKGTQPPQDPPLTDKGASRAQALVTIARDAGVRAIITTEFVRTRSTAEPTATALGVTPEVVRSSTPDHARAVAAEVLKHAGQTVLVVGHSNTIPAIVGALGAPRPKDICDSQYDQLFVVVLGDSGPPRLIQSRYGEASVDDPACAAMQPR